jgi:hypothetical protein
VLLVLAAPLMTCRGKCMCYAAELPCKITCRQCGYIAVHA